MILKQIAVRDAEPVLRGWNRELTTNITRRGKYLSRKKCEVIEGERVS
jgi:hypothetical protein